MDSHVSTLRERTFLWALLISLLLHVLMLFLSVHWKEGKFLPIPAADKSKPEKQIAFEIVETPEASETPPEKAELRSDKNSIARDLNPSTTEGDLPFSKGISAAKTVEPSASPSMSKEMQTVSKSSESSRQETMKAEASQDQAQRQPERSAFSRDRLVAYQEPSQSTTRSFLDQQNGSVRDFGGLSLNTYAWDYAPYLLELKHRIEKNIFPPPVFTRLGSGGQNVFRFRIMPDGSLVGPELVDAQGEHALIATSDNAIKYSVPFKPLPKDFPEDYLEITAKFDYMITGQP